MSHNMLILHFDLIIFTPEIVQSTLVLHFYIDIVSIDVLYYIEY